MMWVVTCLVCSLVCSPGASLLRLCLLSSVSPRGRCWCLRSPWASDIANPEDIWNGSNTSPRTNIPSDFNQLDLQTKRKGCWSYSFFFYYYLYSVSPPLMLLFNLWFCYSCFLLYPRMLIEESIKVSSRIWMKQQATIGSHSHCCLE